MKYSLLTYLLSCLTSISAFGNNSTTAPTIGTKGEEVRSTIEPEACDCRNSIPQCILQV